MRRYTGWEMTPIPDEEYWTEWWVLMGCNLAIALLQLGKIYGNFQLLQVAHTFKRMQAGASQPQDALSQRALLCRA